MPRDPDQGMKMANTWIQHFKDALYTAEQYLKEKKPGQYPQSVTSLLFFIDYVLNNYVDSLIEQELSTILRNPAVVSTMSKGLILKRDGRTIPGEFFRMQGLTITIRAENLTLSMGISEMLKTISEHGKSISDSARSNQINLYIAVTLAQMFTIFITQKGPGIGMEKRDRDSIVSSTVIEPVPPPYRQSQNMSAIKDLIADAFASPDIRGFVDRQYGEGTSNTISGTAQRFNISSIGDIQGGLAKALATRKIAPIIDLAGSVFTNTAGSIYTDDGVKAYDQE
jgi:hypothetical protein